MAEVSRRDMEWRPLPGETGRGELALVWLRRVAVLAGLAVAVTGIFFAISFMRTPAILLEHPNGPLSPYAATHTASGALPAARAGLWIEIPALQIALPIRDGDGSNNIPDWVALRYPGTAAPGTAGNSYIYAHGLWGMFGPLLFAKDGEQVLLHNYTTRAVQSLHITRVVGRIRYDDLSWINIHSDTTLLTLQTCVGAAWNTDRWIVQVAR